MLNISAYWQEMFSGAIIILAVALNMRRRRTRGKSRRDRVAAIAATE
jgi:ribose/xylose/arabinose/galactoside ABC-type transport system permease subunit